MQIPHSNVVVAVPKLQSKSSGFLRLFILATAATLLMSIWMSAHAQTTTFYSGTYYPVPNYYYYVPPQPGYSYPVGPSNGPPNGPVIPPYVTTLPSNGYYAPYSYGGGYPYPVNNYPYWVPQNGVYYSGPAGGGGTIYSNSTVTSNNNGISYGSQGWSLNLGNNTTSSSSSTTVTTHR